MIRDAWLGAMEELMRREEIDFLPALLIYFGGDDLSATLPERFVEPFLIVSTRHCVAAPVLSRRSVSRLVQSPILQISRVAVASALLVSTVERRWVP